MTTDVDALSTFLQTGLVTMVSSVLTFFGVLAALLIINLRLGLAVLCIFPVLVVATYRSDEVPRHHPLAGAIEIFQDRGLFLAYSKLPPARVS